MKKYVLGFALLAAVVACKKEDKVESKTNSGGSGVTNPGNQGGNGSLDQSLLVNREWYLSDVRFTPAADLGNGLTNNLYAATPCIQDDYIILDADQDYIYSQALSLCDPSDNNRVYGYWSLSNDKLDVNAGSGITHYTITELSGNQLKMNTTSIQNGTTYTYYYTYN